MNKTEILQHILREQLELGTQGDAEYISLISNVLTQNEYNYVIDSINITKD